LDVYNTPSSIDGSLRGAVLAVGNFDGVHLGHQRILRTSHALAQVSSAKVIAMTFEPHPLAVLRPDKAPAKLTPWPEKLRLLERAGADAVVRLSADQATLSLSAEDFVRRVLVEQIHPSYIVEGPNFGFGRGRQGGIDTLEAMSAKGGFQVHIVEPYRLKLGDKLVVVSSTLVRECVQSGRAEDAAACLGRPFALIGEVVHGAGEGHKLGYPTINLNVGGQLVPAEGVYAGIAEVNGVHGACAISIGRRPTLGGRDLTIEAFLLDEHGDWYGAGARLKLVKRLRDQRKFVDREALVEQIAADVKATRAAVSNE
jgi:riboflavin kinase/FMN adenylyltransferase